MWSHNAADSLRNPAGDTTAKESTQWQSTTAQHPVAKSQEQSQRWVNTDRSSPTLSSNTASYHNASATPVLSRNQQGSSYRGVLWRLQSVIGGCFTYYRTGITDKSSYQQEEQTRCTPLQILMSNNGKWRNSCRRRLQLQSHATVIIRKVVVVPYGIALSEYARYYATDDYDIMYNIIYYKVPLLGWLLKEYSKRRRRYLERVSLLLSSLDRSWYSKQCHLYNTIGKRQNQNKMFSHIWCQLTKFT